MVSNLQLECHTDIEADKTEKYQRRYPDAGITEVKVNHVWKNNGIIPPGGIIFD